uniref:RRM domain-containing protein n=1 Tax=Ditylenchus dipsaci TaxID=166011 RepID=A0A915EKG6_9BILA
MDKKLLHNKEIRVSWATEYVMQRRKQIPTVGQFTFFVGDLSPDVDSKGLYEVFAELGDITDVKVIRDPLTTNPKAMVLSHLRIESRLRCYRENEWAAVLETNGNSTNVTMEEIFKQTGPDNTSVYVGNMPNSCSGEIIRVIFVWCSSSSAKFNKVRHFKHLGYPSSPIPPSKQHLEQFWNEWTRVYGQTIKCSWGKGDMGEGAKVRSSQNLVDLPACYASNPLTGQYCQNNPLYQQQWQSHWEQKRLRRWDITHLFVWIFEAVFLKLVYFTKL